ncbi:MAG: hypothetical protein ACYSUI_10220 [Planctomycetota bacterium]
MATISNATWATSLGVLVALGLAYPSAARAETRAATPQPAGPLPEVIHGPVQTPLPGHPVVLPAAMPLRDRQVRDSAAAAREMTQEAPRRQVEPQPRPGAFPWSYTPKRSWTYQRRSMGNYEPIRAANYTPKRSWTYHPKRSWAYTPRR